MAIAVGLRPTFTVPYVAIIVDMDEAIYLLSPEDAPLLTGVNSEGNAVLPSSGASQIRYDWLNDLVAVGVGNRQPSGPIYRVFAVL